MPAPPLTWEEIRKLPDRAPIHIEGLGARVLRWEHPGQALEVTACLCTFDPATMDDTHVLARFTESRFEQKQLKIWRRAT